MLERLLSEVMGRGQKVIVIDDGSDFKLDYVEWISMPHGGKKGFWKNWNKAFNLFNESGDDFVLFIPDDVKDIDFEKIDSYRDQLVKQRYIFNVLTDKRKRCWNRIMPVSMDETTEKIGFVDCAFFTNRYTFETLGFHMIPINRSRFRKPNISSGVGQQLTSRVNDLNIPIYRSKTSLVYHGDHSSIMHSVERKRNPLLSIH